MGRHFAQAAEFYDAGRVDLAERLLRLDLEANPEDARALALLALCLIRRRRGREARRAAGDAVRLGPELAFAHYAQASVHFESGGRGRHLRRARRAVEAAIALDPLNPAFLVLQAQTRLRQGRTSEALWWCDRCLQEDPEYAPGQSVRALVLTLLGRPEEARQQAGAALAIDPEAAYAHQIAGITRRYVGDFTAAETHFCEALRLDPEDHVSARCLHRTRRYLNPIRAALRAALRIRLLMPPRGPGRSAWPNWILGGLMFLGVAQSVTWASERSQARVQYLTALGVALGLALVGRVAPDRWARFVVFLAAWLVWLTLLAGVNEVFVVAMEREPPLPRFSPEWRVVLAGQVLFLPAAAGTGLFVLAVLCPKIGNQVAGVLPNETSAARAAGLPGS